MSGRDIFISYSREDRTTARHFAECFEKEGFSVWWDAVLRSGETFDEVIETELKAARAVVVLWSRRSVASRWVRAEATMADRRNKLAPAIIEPCDRPIIFELTHTIDLSEWTGDRVDDPWPSFVKDLHRLVERGKRPRHTSPAITDDGDKTQFSTGAGAFDLSRDEFHCLEFTDGDKLEKRYVVSPLGLKIGRSAPADVILPDARVSRTHCLVELADDHLRVSDLNSTNGTYVNGERISGEAFLAIGSVLKVGNISLTHELRTRADVRR